MTHAVIIAGGRGERLGGVRKADLLLAGKRLVDHVAEALGPLKSPLMIAVGPQDDGRGQRSDAIAVQDLDAPLGGPLAGLAAAVASLQERGIAQGLLVSAAVDGPLLPPDYVAQLSAAIGPAPAVVAAWGDQFYPPNALWQLDAVADLPAQVRAETAPKSLKALLQRLGARQVDWQNHTQNNPFRNINTVADLLALGKMLRT